MNLSAPGIFLEIFGKNRKKLDFFVSRISAEKYLAFFRPISAVLKNRALFVVEIYRQF
jgi:hypothetical protein